MSTAREIKKSDNAESFQSIWEFQEYAKGNGFNTIHFEFTSPNGKTVKARWLDAYYGFIMFDGEKGFNTVDQLVQYGCAYVEYRVIPDPKKPDAPKKKK